MNNVNKPKRGLTPVDLGVIEMRGESVYYTLIYSVHEVNMLDCEPCEIHIHSQSHQQRVSPVLDHIQLSLKISIKCIQGRVQLGALGVEWNVPFDLSRVDRCIQDRAECAIRSS